MPDIDADWATCGESGEGAWGYGTGHTLDPDARESRWQSRDVAATRRTTPINGSGAYSNNNARGHEGGSSRPGGRGTR